MTRDPREAAADSAKSYDEAIRELRLRRIRDGIYEPRSNDPEEMAAFHQWQREREAKA